MTQELIDRAKAMHRYMGQETYLAMIRELSDALVTARTDNERLRAVVDLVDEWHAEAGPGTERERVFGQQVVSLKFLHSEVHKLADGAR